MYFCGLCARYFDNSFHLEGPTFLAGGDDGVRASLCTVEAEAYRRVLRSRCDGATLRELRPGGDVGGDGITCTTLRTGCMVSVERRQSRCREGKGCASFFFMVRHDSPYGVPWRAARSWHRHRLPWPRHGHGTVITPPWAPMAIPLRCYGTINGDAMGDRTLHARS